MIEQLYKYGYLTEHSKALFSTPTLWFSAPSKLNDPFECRPWITFEGTSDDIIASLERVLLRRDRMVTPQAAKVEATSIYLEGRHRDPNTWESLRQEFLRKVQNDVGICCLSRVPDNILMWSHYACDHEGYCIEFEASDEVPVFGEAQPVIYSDSYPVIDWFKTEPYTKVDRVLLTKYTAWAYEQEWRIVDPNALGSHEYPPAMLKSVTFGVRMPARDKLQIREWVAQRGHSVRFYEASQNGRHFAIHRTEVL